jgi:hypothetical protein
MGLLRGLGVVVGGLLATVGGLLGTVFGLLKNVVAGVGGLLRRWSDYFSRRESRRSLSTRPPVWSCGQ